MSCLTAWLTGYGGRYRIRTDVGNMFRQIQSLEPSTTRQTSEMAAPTGVEPMRTLIQSQELYH
ncbi:hypothetical protein ABGV42_00900 [Paenibacillus pabuli]